jgi:cytochrome P450
MAEETQDSLTLRSLVISVFSPAHDGAAVTLSNAMFHLARRPAVWSKLREEVQATKGQELTYELLNSYKYLQWVFKESKFGNFELHSFYTLR